ncbi:MAG: glycosyltransferase [Pyrinomonadaceae bacterium]|nr:glycosyltransferase [Pyrinomonadaceae bacterium]
MNRTGKRIVLTTFGSFGDVHPYMALALELNARGHTAVIATSEIYREKIEGAGIEFHSVRPDIQGPEDPATEELLRKIMNPQSGAEFLFKEMIAPHLRDAYDDLMQAVVGADLLVTHVITFSATIVAQQTGMPWVSSVLAPVSLWSAHDPLVPPNAPWIAPLLRAAGVRVNRAFLSVVRKWTNSWMEPVYKLRGELGLPRGAHPLFDGQHSPALVLALFSEVLGAKQPDWPPQTVVTGFAFYDKKDETPISPELLKFLDAGKPPIVFTLGSSAVFVAGDFFHESIAAARELGERAVLLIGDARNMPREPLPEGIVAFDYAPYGEVLPRASVIVHQGGVSTTAQALRAGRPQLVMPYNHDQPDNAARIARLGVGRTLTRNSYKRARVVRELKELLENPAYAQRAAEVGAKIRSENGARTACEAIEERMKSKDEG